MVTVVGFEPTVFTSRVWDFKSHAFLPFSPHGHKVFVSARVGRASELYQCSALTLSYDTNWWSRWDSNPHGLSAHNFSGYGGYQLRHATKIGCPTRFRTRTKRVKCVEQVCSSSLVLPLHHETINCNERGSRTQPSTRIRDLQFLTSVLIGY